MKYGYRKPSIKKRIAARTSIKRRIRAKYRVPNPKKAAYNRVYYRTTKKACYIATAVYGDIDAHEVNVLRRYRDDVLMTRAMGRLFCAVYYSVSPHLVRWFQGNGLVARVTRRVLDRIVDRIEDVNR